MNVDSRLLVTIDTEKQSSYRAIIKGFASDSLIPLEPHPETDRAHWDTLRENLLSQIDTLKFLGVKKKVFSFFARVKGEVFFLDQGLVLYVKEIQVQLEPGQRVLVDFEIPIETRNKVRSTLSFY